MALNFPTLLVKNNQDRLPSLRSLEKSIQGRWEREYGGG